MFDFQPGILGIFQKLLASKVNDHHGFSLINCLFMHAPRYSALSFLSFELDAYEWVFTICLKLDTHTLFELLLFVANL